MKPAKAPAGAPVLQLVSAMPAATSRQTIYLRDSVPVGVADFMFKEGPSLSRLSVTDVNGDRSVGPDVSNLLYFVNCSFKNGPAPCVPMR